MGSAPESDAYGRTFKLFLSTRRLLRGRIRATRDRPPDANSPPVAEREIHWSEQRERVEVLVELRKLGVIDQRQLDAEKQGIRDLRDRPESKASGDG